MRYDIVLLLLLLVLPPSSVRSAKPKATGTAQKGIRGYFAPVVKTQQNADDDAAHDISDDGTGKTKDGTNEEKQCAETPALLTQSNDVTREKFAKQLDISDNGTVKTKDGINWTKCYSQVCKENIQIHERS